MSEDSSSRDRLSDNGGVGVKRKSSDKLTASSDSSLPKNKSLRPDSDSAKVNDRLSLPAVKNTSKPGISMKLAPKKSGSDVSSSTKQSTPRSLLPKSGLAAAAFAGDSEDDEQEEMPPEARIKMRNMGRDTPTSAGPNSYCKSRIGFCNSRKLAEKEITELSDSH